MAARAIFSLALQFLTCAVLASSGVTGFLQLLIAAAIVGAGPILDTLIG